MYEVEFDWDDANINHLWDEHRVRPYEAEEVYYDPRRFFYQSDAVTEDRRVVVGTTLDGRMLAVVITPRAPGHIRVATARETNEWETRRYRKRGRKGQRGR